MYIFSYDMETPLRRHMPSLAGEPPKNTESNVITI